jgi:hypothetical protein
MVDPELMRRVRAGEYVVDPHAVAGAMLRAGVLRPGPSAVLEAPQAGDPPPGADEPEPGSGLDPA